MTAEMHANSPQPAAPQNQRANLHGKANEEKQKAASQRQQQKLEDPRRCQGNSNKGREEKPFRRSLRSGGEVVKH